MMELEVKSWGKFVVDLEKVWYVYLLHCDNLFYCIVWGT